MQKQYVVGFIFNQNLDKVLLIKKNKPINQVGKLNGVGGKIEPYDKTPLDAFVREVHEETALLLKANECKYFATIDDHDMYVYVFTTYGDYEHKSHTTTDEQIQWIDVKDVAKYPHMQNIYWLIPLAQNVLTSEKVFVTLKY